MRLHCSYRWLPIAGSLALALLLSSSVRADEAFVPHVLQNRVGLETAWWPAADASVVTLSARARVRVQKHFALELEVPWVIGSLRDIPGTVSAPGNVILGLRSAMMVGSSGVVFIGSGVLVGIPTLYGVPATNAGLDRLSMLTFAAASESLAGADRFFPEFTFVRLLFDLEIRPRRWIAIRMEASVVVWVPTGRDATQPVAVGATPLAGSQSPGSHVSVEQGAELEFRLPAGLTCGTRVEVVIAGSPVGTNDWYSLQSPTLSGEFFVGYEPSSSGLSARLGWLAGTSGLYVPYDRDSVGELRFGIGYRW